jgi:PII-like signaling protein
MSRFKKRIKKLGKLALTGAALYGASRLGTSKTLKGSKIINTVKTLPVTTEYIGVPDIENPWSIKYEFPTTLNDGGEIVIGKNVDKDLL